jgi:hypothetical protein
VPCLEAVGVVVVEYERSYLEAGIGAFWYAYRTNSTLEASFNV